MSDIIIPDFDMGFVEGFLFGKKNENNNNRNKEDDLWTYPEDWIQMPEPTERQVFAVVSNLRFGSGGYSEYKQYGLTYWLSRGYSALLDNGHYENRGLDGAATIDWGDGTTEILKDQYSGIEHTYISGTGTIIKNGSEQWMISISGEGEFDNIRVTTVGLFAIKYGSKVLATDNVYVGSATLHYAKFLGEQNVIHNTDGLSFNACTSLKQVEFATPLKEIPDWVFGGCHSLETIDLSEVKTIGIYGLADCYGLRKDINLKKLEVIKRTGLQCCSNIRVLDLPELTTIEDQGLMYCNNLSTIIAPKLTSIGSGAINNSFSLRTLYAPNLMSVGQGGLSYCYALSYPNFVHAENCVFGDNACDNCYNLLQ